MKKYLFLIPIFLITTCLSFAQDVEKELYLKHSVQQDGESYQFLVLDNDKKGVLHYDKTKYYFWYKSQKVMSTQGGSSGVLLDGKFESFYDNKQLSKRGDFKKGLKDGEWYYWREDGSLIRTENWNKGTKKTVTTYDDKGGVISIQTFKDRKEVETKKKFKISSLFKKKEGETGEPNKADAEKK